MGKCKWTNIMNKPLMERGFWLRRFYKEAHKWMCKRVYNEVMAPPEWRNKPIPAIENDLVVEPPSPPKTPIAYDDDVEALFDDSTLDDEDVGVCYMGMGVHGVEVKDMSKKVIEIVPIQKCASNMAIVHTRSRRATRHQPPNDGEGPSNVDGNEEPNPDDQANHDGNNDPSNPHQGRDGDDPNDPDDDDDDDGGDEEDWDFEDDTEDDDEDEEDDDHDGNNQVQHVSRGGRPLPQGPLLESTIPPNDDWGDDDDMYVDDNMEQWPHDDLPSDVTMPSPSWHTSDDDDDSGEVEQDPLDVVNPPLPETLPHEPRFTVPPNKPKWFTGLKKKGTESTEVTTWLNKLELYFKMCHLDESMWVTRAYYLLESPAFEVIKARIKSLTKEGLWTETWDQFTKLMVTHFGDVEQNLAYRAKLHRLVVLDGDILRYIKLFNETANKITETLSNEELISDFFKGIKDRKILQDVMIDPKTGGVWKTWTHLYEYVVGKYSVLRYHGDRERPPRDKRTREGSPRRSRSPKRRNNDRDKYKERPFDRDRRDKARKPHDNNKPRNERDRREHRPKNDRDHDLKTLDVSKLVVGQRTSREQRDMLSKENRCFYCFKVGHSKSECRLVKRAKDGPK